MCTSALFTKWTYTCLTITLDVYEAFVNLEESFQEGQFYAQITQNLLLYLQMFYEWGPWCVKSHQRSADSIAEEITLVKRFKLPLAIISAQKTVWQGLSGRSFQASHYQVQCKALTSTPSNTFGLNWNRDCEPGLLIQHQCLTSQRSSTEWIGKHSHRNTPKKGPTISAMRRITEL